ncbi:phospholipase D family protein [Pseudomonas sp. OTU5201]|uniref:phospholipase D family protein n=1 Tax=Pseudomonas sp. OTU5201 TaxID=3043850 RepID=UPI00313EBF9C
MEILDYEDSLETYLGELNGKKITIVSAFASGTEPLIDQMIENGNQLDIIVGSINSLTSPDFIEHCLNESNPDLALSVDFRYQASVNWKLYLIEPDVVIVGSANLTQVGVSLVRDTCTVITDAALHDAYLARVQALKAIDGVMACSHSQAFEDALDSYKQNHRRMQAGLARTAEYLDSEGWLGDDINQSIPLFIWYSDHSPQSEDEARNHLKSSSDGVAWDDVREFFTYECAEGALPYEEGDVVLTARCNGSHIGFYTFDRILYREGTYYIYAYRKKRYTQPFKLDGDKELLKDAIPAWYEDGRTEINRADILRVIQ